MYCYLILQGNKPYLSLCYVDHSHKNSLMLLAVSLCASYNCTHAPTYRSASYAHKNSRLRALCVHESGMW